MRQISAKLLGQESLVELKAGHRLQLVQGGHTIAEIVPVQESTSQSASEFPDASLEEDERLAAVERLRQMMHQGIHLGGLRITNRDELYERD
jgi:antitoxin (DNA-binding transcriptional repressor) of toxin-antitoxin stability system